jgi:hypothetical protein
MWDSLGTMKNERLAILRLLVLKLGETQPSIWWNSTGLQKAGQDDLKFLFPRTAINAALKHAQSLAQSKHDASTRAQGVRHLFRLPVGLEVTLHQTLLDLETTGKLEPLLESLGWDAIQGVTYESLPAQEGPVNLGTLDIHSPKGLSRLANVYRAAFEAGVSCVPYFTLSDAA